MPISIKLFHAQAIGLFIGLRFHFVSKSSFLGEVMWGEASDNISARLSYHASVLTKVLEL